VTGENQSVVEVDPAANVLDLRAGRSGDMFGPVSAADAQEVAGLRRDIVGTGTGHLGQHREAGAVDAVGAGSPSGTHHWGRASTRRTAS